MSDETLDLIVKEAYHVEKSKEKCFATFDNQMKEMEMQYIQMEEAAKAYHAQQALNPNQGGLESDKAMMKMMEMGLPVPGMGQGMGGMPPGMMGMPPPGMFPPGMFPPGMFPPGMFPPGMGP